MLDYCCTLSLFIIAVRCLYFIVCFHERSEESYWLYNTSQQPFTGNAGEGLYLCNSLEACKIRCYPMHPLNGVLPGPYVPVWVTRGALVAHRYTYAPPCCRTSQYSRTYFPLSVSLWNDLANPVFDGVGLTGFKSRANALYWPKLLHPYYSLPLFFPFFSFCL